MNIDKISFYSNDVVLHKIKEHNLGIAKANKGCFRFSAVFIDLNGGCNLRCPGCFKGMNYAQPKERLRYGEITKIIDFAKKRGAKAVVYAGAGEPLMDNDFWKVLCYAHKNGIRTILFTNGTFINRENARILYKENATVIIKINTLDRRKQDDMVGGFEGASEKIWRGFNYLVEAGFKSPRLAIDSLISKQNAKDLKDLLRFCRQNNVIPYFGSFITKGQRKENIKGRVLPQKEFDKLFLDLQKIDVEEFGIRTCVLKGSRVYSQKPCIKNYVMFSVRINGDVALCVSDTNIIGNIRKQPLTKIFSPSNKKILQSYKNGCKCSLTTTKTYRRCQ